MIFIASQTFMLTIGVLSLNKPELLWLTTIISLIIIWVIWVPVVNARHKYVDYNKYSSELSPTDQEIIFNNCSEKDYVKNTEKKRKLANERITAFYKSKKKMRNWRITRWKMDILIPVSFTLIWLGFFYNTKLVEIYVYLSGIYNSIQSFVIQIIGK